MDKAAEEKFSWKKYVAGVFNPINFAKYTSFGLQIALISIVSIFLLKTGVLIKNWIFPRPAEVPSIGSISGKGIDVSTDKKTKIGLNIL